MEKYLKEAYDEIIKRLDVSYNRLLKEDFEKEHIEKDSLYLEKRLLYDMGIFDNSQLRLHI